MIVTEQGLQFRRDGDCWRCVQHPELLMLSGVGYYAIAGREDRRYSDAQEALACLIGSGAAE